MNGPQRVVASSFCGAMVAIAVWSLVSYGVVDSVVGFLQIGGVMVGVSAVSRLASDEYLDDAR